MMKLSIVKSWEWLPIYAIRVLAIRELRCIPRIKLSLEGIVGRLIAFESSNFDNYRPEKIESTFKAKLMIKDTKEVKPKKKKKNIKYASSDNNTNEDDVK